MSDSKPPEIDTLSFEQAMEELEKIVRGLESGDIGLEQSIAAYERGNRLKEHCEKKLAGAKARIDKITIGANGDIQSEPTEIQ